MRAAIVAVMGIEPILGEIDLQAPRECENLIKVTAAALSHAAKTRAFCAHYSTNGEFPLIVEIGDEMLQVINPTDLNISCGKAPFTGFDAAWPKNGSTLRAIFDLIQGAK